MEHPRKYIGIYLEFKGGGAFKTSQNRYERNKRSFFTMVKWAKDDLLQANDGKMLVNDGEMLVNYGEMIIWSYTHSTIINVHFTIISLK